MYCFLRRCPLWPMKLKVKRFVRVTKGVSHQILKNQKNYCNKAMEIVLDSESSQLPFWKGFSGTYLIDEIVLFLLFPDEELTKVINLSALFVSLLIAICEAAPADKVPAFTHLVSVPSDERT